MWMRSLACAVLGIASLLPTHGLAQQLVLVDFAKRFELAKVERQDATLSLEAGVLRMETTGKDGAPQVVLTAPEGRWNLTRYHEVALDVRNLGPEPVTVGCRAEDPSADGTRGCSTATVTLVPGERSVVRVTLTQALPPELRMKLFGMRALPLGISAAIDSSQVTRLVLFVAATRPGRAGWSSAVRVPGSSAEPTQPVDEDVLLPMIDRFGQFIHKEWPRQGARRGRSGGAEGGRGGRPGGASGAGRVGPVRRLEERSATAGHRFLPHGKSTKVSGGWWIRKATSSGRWALTA